MIPSGTCSTNPVVALYSKANALPFTNLVDYEDGPVYIQDTSSGMDYQVWRARLVGDTVYITSPTTPETPVFTVRGISEISLTFDQNARYVITYLVAGEVWVYWFDTIPSRFVHTLVETGAYSPRISLDDKRKMALSSSNIILGYVKDNCLYCRSQKDRYQIPYLLEENIGGRLLRIGMNINYRFQFIFQAQPYGDYSCTVGLNCL